MINHLNLWSICAVLIFSSALATLQRGEPLYAQTRPAITGPHVIIYKTKKNYDKLVPITLSKDKKSVDSYPDVKDIYYNGKLAYPTKLKDSFLLDNRGIGPNTTFIKLTYEEYSKLPQTPSSTDLINMVVDNDPFTEMYELGSRSSYKDVVKEVNELIRKKELGRKLK